MPNLTDFQIAKRWPPVNDKNIQLYSFPTPNGVKVSIALEELVLPYDAHLVSIMKDDQFDPGFLEISPNNKIPAIIDPNGPDGQATSLFESGAILLYLAGKTGKLMPQDAAGHHTVMQWLMFQMGGLGPMFGQLGFFYKFAGKEIEDPRPRQRYVDEAKRLLGVLEDRLTDRQWIMDDDFTIADIALLGWISSLVNFYGAGDLVDRCRTGDADVDQGAVDTDNRTEQADER